MDTNFTPRVSTQLMFPAEVNGSDLYVMHTSFYEKDLMAI